MAALWELKTAHRRAPEKDAPNYGRKDWQTVPVATASTAEALPTNTPRFPAAQLLTRGTLHPTSNPHFESQLRIPTSNPNLESQAAPMGSWHKRTHPEAPDPSGPQDGHPPGTSRFKHASASHKPTHANFASRETPIPACTKPPGLQSAIPASLANLPPRSTGLHDCSGTTQYRGHRQQLDPRVEGSVL
jgi:hypothetical protein